MNEKSIEEMIKAAKLNADKNNAEAKGTQGKKEACSCSQKDTCKNEKRFARGFEADSETDPESKFDMDTNGGQIADEEITVICDDSETQSVAEKKRSAELLDALQRLQADFENYRRRTADNSKSFREDGRRDVLEKLLPVMDAFSHARRMTHDKSVLQGVELVFLQLTELMNQFGVKKMEPLGKEFNPAFHNSVFVKKDEKNAGRVVEVFQDGYFIGEKVLRPASVVVGE